MARTFSGPALALLQSGNLQARWLMTMYLDSGTSYFCDDWMDLTDGTYTYIGASALCTVASINSSAPFAAESVTLTIDGTRLQQAGFTDPAALFRAILGYNLVNRRVDLSMGFMAMGATQISLVVPVYAGKINYARIEDLQTDFGVSDTDEVNTPCNLTIVLDSLATRYQWSNSRTRSYQDQLQIDSTDQFFKFVSDTVAQELNLYWGMKNPVSTAPIGRTYPYNGLNIPYGSLP